MGNQKEQNEVQEESQQAEGSQPQENPDMTPEQRIAMCEHFLAEAMKGYQLAGQAINRLESYTFILVDLILKNEIATFDEMKDLQEKLNKHDDLLDFWGVPKAEENSTATSSGS